MEKSQGLAILLVVGGLCVSLIQCAKTDAKNGEPAPPIKKRVVKYSPKPIAPSPYSFYPDSTFRLEEGDYVNLVDYIKKKGKLKKDSLVNRREWVYFDRDSICNTFQLRFLPRYTIDTQIKKQVVVGIDTTLIVMGNYHMDSIRAHFPSAPVLKLPRKVKDGIENEFIFIYAIYPTQAHSILHYHGEKDGFYWGQAKKGYKEVIRRIDNGF